MPFIYLSTTTPKHMHQEKERPALRLNPSMTVERLNSRNNKLPARNANQTLALRNALLYRKW